MINIKNNFLNKKNSLKVIIENNAPSFFIVGYYFFYLFYLQNPSEVPFLSIASVFLILSLVWIFFVKKIYKKDKFIIACMFVMTIGYFLQVYFIKNRSFVFFILVATYFSLGLLIIKSKLNINIMKFSFIVHVLFFSIHIIIGDNPNELFSISQNVISSIMMVQCTIVYISEYQNGKNITILPALITVLISAWAGGRAGFLCSLLILFSVIIFSKNKKEITIGKIMFIVSLSIVLLVLIKFVFSDFFIQILNRLTDQGIVESVRSELIERYFYRISLEDIILGRNLAFDPLYRFVSLNTHNSYLQLHAIYGLFGIIAIFFGLIKQISIYIKSKNFLLLFILITILIRIFSETHAFTNFMDPIIYWLIFNYNCQKEDITNEIL